MPKANFIEKRLAEASLFSGGRGWIRTTEGNNRQIYSLFPLATRELSHIDAMHCGAGGRTRTPDLLITNLTGVE